jgi:hypothetical protein
MMILLSFAFTLNLAFEPHATAWLREAFVASGMHDTGAFVVRNSLTAASEILIRTPIAALGMSLIGSLFNSCITRSKTLAVLAAWIMPPVLVAGAAALWHADSLERVARPPFVLTGVLIAGIALCSVHPIWSGLHRRRNADPS